MQRQRGELVPVAEVLADLGGPIQALRETPPPARRGFTVADRRWCMNRNWPATNPTHRSITYQERTTMAYRARPSG